MLRSHFKTAMILAAGRGERLRPLTDQQPKALCLVQGVPLIEHHVRRLAHAGYERIVINHAHLGGQIRQHFEKVGTYGVTLSFTPEPPGGLETGGGIFNALPWLGDTPFITVNADIFTDYPFESLTLPEHSLAHLVLIQQKPTLRSDFGLKPTGQVCNEPRDHLFAGIACYTPLVFKHSHPGRYSVTPLLRQLATQHQLTGEAFHGVWLDVGTPERLLRANQMQPSSAQTVHETQCRPAKKDQFF